MGEEISELASELIAPLKRIKVKLKLVKLIEKAKAEYDKNNYSGCEDACNKILEESPSNSVALRGLGCVMQAKGDMEQALEYYTLALEHSNNKEIEYTLIGTVYYLENNLEAAINYYNLAIEINDNYDPAYEGKNQSMLEYHLQIADLQDNLIKRNLL